MGRGTNYSHQKVIKMLDLGASNKDISELFDVANSTVAHLRTAFGYAKGGDLESLRNFEASHASSVKYICEYFGFPDELIHPKPIEVKEEPVVEEVSAAEPMDNTAIFCGNMSRLVSMLLDEQKKTNELLIQMMDVVMPHYYEQIRGQLDAIQNAAINNMNADADILLKEMQTQTGYLDNIRYRVKGNK